jgi:hypothetical protein
VGIAIIAYIYHIYIYNLLPTKLNFNSIFYIFSISMLPEDGYKNSRNMLELSPIYVDK